MVFAERFLRLFSLLTFYSIDPSLETTAGYFFMPRPAAVFMRMNSHRRAPQGTEGIDDFSVPCGALRWLTVLIHLKAGIKNGPASRDTGPCSFRQYKIVRIITY